MPAEEADSILKMYQDSFKKCKLEYNLEKNKINNHTNLLEFEKEKINKLQVIQVERQSLIESNLKNIDRI